MKEELKKYNEYKYTLKILRRNLRIEQNREVNVGGGSNFEINGDIRPTGYMNNNIENQVITKTDKIKQLEAQIKDIEERIDIIDSALKTLKNNDRIAVQMRFFDRLEYDTIATTLGLASSKEAEQKIRIAVLKMDKIYKNTVKIQQK